ncbi:MAG TPA: SRPBCC family protein [Candidatus Eisenbacteria bacterium]|jgi:carbon monoxide dehydrogenase subunit G
MLGCLAPLVLLAVLAGPSDVTVALRDGRGSCGVHGSFAVPVSRTAAWQVLTDYDSLGRFVRSIEASHLERHPDGRLLVRQSAVGGAFLFRRHVRVLLELELDPGRRIGFRDVLGKDFQRYVGEWRLSADSSATRVEYQLEADPRGLVARTFCRGPLRIAAQELLTQVRDEMIRRAERESAR